MQMYGYIYNGLLKRRNELRLLDIYDIVISTNPPCDESLAGETDTHRKVMSPPIQ